MRFVSSYSLAAGARGQLQIVELNVQEATNGLRLVLTESPYRGGMSIGRYVVGMDRGRELPRILFAPVTPRSDSLIVADQLGRCTFEYLREPRTPTQPAEWRAVWDDLQQLPAAVRIVLEPAKPEARLQPVTIVAQVRARYAPPSGPGVQPYIDPRAIEVPNPRGGTMLVLPR